MFIPWKANHGTVLSLETSRIQSVVDLAVSQSPECAEWLLIWKPSVSLTRLPPGPTRPGSMQPFSSCQPPIFGMS